MVPELVVATNYVGLAIKTDCLYNDVLLGRLQNPTAARLLHAVIGICTEVGEFQEGVVVHRDSVNVLEECGDICWYLALMCDELGTPFEHIITLANSHPVAWPEGCGISSLSIEAGNLQDVIKRHLFYGTPINIEKLLQGMEQMMRHILYVIRQHNGTLSIVLTANIDKLQKRYPQKFSEHHAVNRDTNTERETLERHL